MADHDMIPVRDLNTDPAGQLRKMVNKWTRDELEDKYLRNYEENIVLKKHARKQEEKIKKMATKLLRLVNDRKKLGGEAGKMVVGDDRFDDLTEKTRDLEKQNHNLKEKLLLAKQQIAALNQRTSAYEYVQPRIDTGIPHRPCSPSVNVKISKSLRVMGPSHTGKQKRVVHSPVLQQYSYREETPIEKKMAEDKSDYQKKQIEYYENEIKSLNEQLRSREGQFQEEITRLQQQRSEDNRANLQESVDLMKLQREVASKSAQFTDIQARYSDLEENMYIMKANRDELMLQMERLNVELKDEQNKVLTLQNEIRKLSAKERENIDLKEQVDAVQRDNDILKEANEKLVASAFDLEREREWRQRENQLKVQIAQLEATIKADLGEKGSVIDRYTRERDEKEKLEAEFRELQVTYYQLKEENDDLQEKMKFFTRESAVDFTELEEALFIVKQKKQKEMKPPDFLQQVDDEKTKDYKSSLLTMQAEYAETVHELEKTRSMLIVQHKINKDYQQEVDSANQRFDELKKEYEMKLEEYARLLDIRAARIRKLEHQMKDVAYGTRQYKIPADADTESTMDLDETISLERGQNLFEIHVHKLNLSKEALGLIGDEEPSLFCTWEFFEFEIQSTPVCRGPRPLFDFTSQYVVKVDDFFLHYLQKNSCTLELHQSFGQDYRTIAACQLIFKEIFDKQHGRIHGVASLTGVGDGETGVGYGTVEYWIRLKVPMEQALRLYKERTKALGYMTHNDQVAKENLRALDEAANDRPMDNVNQLHVKIKQCNQLKARRPNVQPSPYCVYSFFDFGDHDTAIISNSNHPVFNDHKIYPVAMTSDLDQYLRQEHLQIFVFDDVDPEENTYIGMVNVPLLSLANNKSLEGPFDLRAPDGTNSGLIELELRWQYSYMTLQSKAKRKHQHMEVTFEKEEPVKLVEETPLPKSRIVANFQQSHKPSATSTPMPKQGDVDREKDSSLIRDISVVQKEDPTPKPFARKKLNIEKEELVDETVKNVVHDFLPDASDTFSSTRRASGSERTMSDTDRTPVPEPEKSDEEEVEEEVAEEIEESAEYEEEIVEEEEVEEAIEEEEVNEPSPVPQPPTPTPSTPSSVASEKKEKSPKPSPRHTRNEEDMEQESIVSRYKEVKEKISESESEPQKYEPDSEGVVVRGRRADRSRVKNIKNGNTVIVTVSNLSLEDDSRAAQNDNINRLYVSYRFLGLPADETETPYSLPKPRFGRQIQFNFSKTIQVDLENHYDRRQNLAAMLLPGHPDKGRLRFEVISEPPPNDKDGECEDVGVAFVSIPNILINKQNVKDQDLEIYDFNDEETVIGTLKVTVECLAALEAIDKEMVEGTY